MSSISFKSILPIITFVILSLTILFCYYANVGKPVSDALTAWPVTLATFATILGVVTFCASHAKKMVKRAKGWYYNAIAVGAFLFTFIAAITYDPLFDYIIANVTSTLEVALLCYVGFYNLILFYRATRVRTADVALLLISTILVMLWMAPIGGVIHPIFPVIGKWINDIPSGGAMKGMLICIAIGMIGLFIRALTGRERAYLGGE